MTKFKNRPILLIVLGALCAVAVCAAVAASAIALVQLNGQGEKIEKQATNAVDLAKSNSSAIADIKAARSENLKTREETTKLLCDINDILTDFIEAPPPLPRDPPALMRLRAERCDELLAKVEVK